MLGEDPERNRVDDPCPECGTHSGKGRFYAYGALPDAERIEVLGDRWRRGGGRGLTLGEALAVMSGWACPTDHGKPDGVGLVQDALLDAQSRANSKVSFEAQYSCVDKKCFFCRADKSKDEVSVDIIVKRSGSAYDIEGTVTVTRHYKCQGDMTVYR